jgi:gliding motility-associated-like protein
MGSVSPVSANVVINPQPPIPSAPVIGAISQPSCSIATGTVLLTGLLSGNSWTLTRSPDGVITTGTSISTSVTGVKPGIYAFKITNSYGCISVTSASVSISPQPTFVPKVIVTNPAPVCAPATVNLNDATLTLGSTKGLTYTYWVNPEATVPYLTPITAGSGTYYINGTTESGCSAIEAVIVTVNTRIAANAGPDQVLENLFAAELAAEDPGPDISGRWTVIKGKGELFDSTYARTSVTNLSPGKNIFLWTVKNGVCPSTFDSVAVTVRDFLIPTLITPNHDGRNDYFIIGGNKLPPKTELVIFDRRGVRVFLNENYDNKWDGVDFNGNQLPDDTYFFAVKSGNGIAINGYVVIRR